MSAVTVVKDETGKLAGLGEKGARAWARFRALVERMEVGETLAFEWHEPRSPKHHRLWFSKLHALLDRQEQFADADQLRAWLVVGAGYADFVPGPTGRMVALPRSIAWHRMDEGEFSELHRATDDFLRTEHAQRFLWPHLSDEQRRECVDSLLAEYER